MVELEDNDPDSKILGLLDLGIEFAVTLPKKV
jgi:hypothetical protein